MIEALIAGGVPAKHISASGFDQDPAAVAQAQQVVQTLGVAEVDIQSADFLTKFEKLEPFDCIISNPPYVRTQVMGAKQAQRLAKRFGLTGRVDLYQVFTAAILECLGVNAAVGLLTSNRFMTVKAGESMRRLLREGLRLKQIFDLGDSRLFEAAVLPVVLTGNKKCQPQMLQSESPSEFCRIYSSDRDEDGGGNSKSSGCLFDVIEAGKKTGAIETDQGRFEIQRGFLAGDTNWRLSNKATQQWLGKIHRRRRYRFADVATIKVGIKTTADSVFIGDQWPDEMELLQPLLTHHVAERWRCQTPQKRVLYPYDMQQGSRSPVELANYPAASAWLQRHKKQLSGRKYLIDAGRAWYEIWVAHQPDAWQQSKIVWPDISEQPKFFLDESGAIVNGDCYWLTLRDGFEQDWLYLILAIANSSVATEYYDTVFHNKLYANRRRFMTQYVADFPLPDLHSELALQAVALVKQLIAGKPDDGCLDELSRKMLLGP